jgi:cytochrome c553
MPIIQRPTLALALGASLLSPVAATAGDPELGKARAATCVSCHGVQGISPNPQWPNLAGQKEQYLIASLKAYRDGQRQDAIMAPLSSGLSDEDIENLAAWYASLACGDS